MGGWERAAQAVVVLGEQGGDLERHAQGLRQPLGARLPLRPDRLDRQPHRVHRQHRPPPPAPAAPAGQAAGQAEEAGGGHVLGEGGRAGGRLQQIELQRGRVAGDELERVEGGLS